MSVADCQSGKKLTSLGDLLLSLSLSLSLSLCLVEFDQEEEGKFGHNFYPRRRFLPAFFSCSFGVVSEKTTSKEKNFSSPFSRE